MLQFPIHLMLKIGHFPAQPFIPTRIEQEIPSLRKRPEPVTGSLLPIHTFPHIDRAGQRDFLVYSFIQILIFSIGIQDNDLRLGKPSHRHQNKYNIHSTIFLIFMSQSLLFKQQTSQKNINPTNTFTLNEGNSLVYTNRISREVVLTWTVKYIS